MTVLNSPPGLDAAPAAGAVVLMTIAGLTLIPASYYTFLLILVVPEVTVLAGRWGPFLLASGLAVLSFAPVLVCCWPERTPRSQRPDVADA